MWLHLFNIEFLFFMLYKLNYYPMSSLFAITLIILLLVGYNVFVTAEDNNSWILLANNLKEKGNYSGAISIYDKSLSMKPNNKEIIANKGDTLNQMGNYSGAISIYDKALRIDNNYIYALDGKGWALLELGNYTQALPYFDKALQIDPTLVDALNFKGQTLYKFGNYTGAHYYLNKALQLDPNNLLLNKYIQNLALNKTSNR